VQDCEQAQNTNSAAQVKRETVVMIQSWTILHSRRPNDKVCPLWSH